MISKEKLLKDAKFFNYKPELLEKVYYLLSSLAQFMEVPYLQKRLALKGGTALNLFHFNQIPRLSIDIDLNYIGHIEREKMQEERPLVQDAINRIFMQNQFEPYRTPSNHAGGKMIWRYSSALGQKGNLNIDLNYMYRQPLWPIEWLTPKIQFESKMKIPVLNIHELAAGKLSALFARQASRDLFDTHNLLVNGNLEPFKLRFSFVSYIAMTNIPLNALTPESINYEVTELQNQLFPVLQQDQLPKTSTAVKSWANKLLDDLRSALNVILPLNKTETRFLETLRTTGTIQADLLSEDKLLMEAINTHPAILWAAMSGRKH